MLHLQGILIHPHRDLFSCQSMLPVEFPMFEPDVPMFIDLACKLGRVQGPRKDLFGNGAPQHSTQHCLRAVSPVLAGAMGVVMFVVVVVPPGLVSLLDLRPVARVGKCVISEPSLDREQGLRIILPGFSRINVLFADTKHVVELESNR